MMDVATLLTFTAMAFALIVTPGPDMLLLMTRSVAQGRVAGLVTLAGICAGCYFHARSYRDFMRCVVLALRLDPAQVVRLLGYPIRRLSATVCSRAC